MYVDYKPQTNEINWETKFGITKNYSCLHYNSKKYRTVGVNS